ncbi:hypothetical protein ACWOC1_03435 [Enterococcus quebecensis]|nr:hypothetical protein [Enterococcus quebecensis]
MKMKKGYLRAAIIGALYVIVPLILGALISFWIKTSIFIPTAVIYAVMLLFLVPSDSLFHSVVDYNAKSINPTYRPAASTSTGGKTNELIHFVLVFISLALCLLVLYVSYL